MKFNDERNLRKASSDALTEIRKNSSLIRIPRKPTTLKDSRDRKRNFALISKEQREASLRARMAEEAAARRLLRQNMMTDKQKPPKAAGGLASVSGLLNVTAREEAATTLLRRNTEGKQKPSRTTRVSASESKLQDVTKLVTSLSGQEFQKLCDSIKRRRLQLVKPTSPSPADRLHPILGNPLRARQVLVQDAVGAAEEVPLRAELASKEEDPAELEERLLRRLLNNRRNRALRNLVVKEEALLVPQLADRLEAEATRHNNLIFCYHLYFELFLLIYWGYCTFIIFMTDYSFI